MRAHRSLARFLVSTAVLLGVSAVVSTVANGLLDVRHRPRGRFIRVRGGLVHVLEAGPADADVTLVMLHGGSINAEDPMLAFEGRLGPRVRLIAVDRPGAGWSDRPDGRTAALLSFQEETVLAVLDVMGVRDFVVLGHSWAGALAVRMAAVHSDRVEGLAVISGATQPWAVGKALLQRRNRLKLLTDPAVRGIFGPLTLIGARRMADLIFSPQKPPPGYLARVGVRLLARPDRFIANAEDLVFLEQGLEMLAPRIREVAAPTLIIHGDADKVVPVEQGRGLRDLIAGSRYLELPGIGHMPHHAASARVIAAVEDLIRTVRAGRSSAGTRALRAG